MNNDYPTKQLTHALLNKRGVLIGIILLVALIAFEAFNFSTTQYALQDLLGDLSFAGISWATILAIAFCGIDFAGIARLFMPEERFDSTHNDAWYLFGAWLLAASMNAMLTWWGVSIAIVDHQLRATAIISQNFLVQIVPIFIALIVWVTRILLIGTFSIAGPRLFSTASRTTRPLAGLSAQTVHQPSMSVPAPHRPDSRPTIKSPRPIPAQQPKEDEPEYIPDPSYVPLQSVFHSLSGRESSRDNNKKAKF